MSDTRLNKAWEYTTRGPLSASIKLTDRPIPKAGKGEAVVRVKACAINPIDVKLAAFPGWLRRGAGASAFGLPFVPCFDFAGVVTEAGEGCAWRVGDEVMGRTVKLDGNGSLQEYLLLPPSAVCIRKPSTVSWTQAAGLPLIYITIYGCLIERTGLNFEPAKTSSAADSTKEALNVLILGGTSATGGVAIQLAKVMGLKVIVTCSGTSEGLVRKSGADEIIDYKTENIYERAKASALAPYALILDCVGGTELIPHMDELLLTDPSQPKLGQYISIAGDIKDQGNASAFSAIGALGRQSYRSIRGHLNPYVPNYTPLRSWVAGRPYSFYLDPPSQKALETAPAFLEKVGGILIDSEIPFEDAPKAFERSESGRSKGKVVIIMEGDSQE